MSEPRTETTDVVVIGAGPAGLAVGAGLRKLGINFAIVEKERLVASSWRRHYARLHLHTVNRYSSLPYLAFPRDYPRYVPKNLMIRYLDAYAANFDLKPRFGEAVRAVRRDGGDWLVETTASLFRASSVVVASGFNATPFIPDIPGLSRANVKVFHSADYVSGEPFAGQSVLVVGMGNTGAEIALDLAEAGARSTISLRDGVHIVPRELLGIPIQVVAMVASRLFPESINDAIFPLILDVAPGHPSKFGMKRPPCGILEQIRTAGKIPVIDIGTLAKISEGAIAIAPEVAEITSDGVAFKGGAKDRFDAIILATGYRPSYAAFLESNVLQHVDSDPAGPFGTSGIYFVGFRNVVTGLLRQISQEAIRVADDIARKKSGARPAPI